MKMGILIDAGLVKTKINTLVYTYIISILLDRTGRDAMEIVLKIFAQSLDHTLVTIYELISKLI